MRYGYARVSTEEQQTHAQTDALRSAGCGIIMEEKRSGGNMRRPVLQALLDGLQPGDVLVVYKYDRIARSLMDLLKIQRRVMEARAEFISITESMDTTTPAGRMLFHILGAFAEFEREMIRERTVAGLRAAAERGRFGGAKPKIPDEELPELVRQFNGGATKSALARQHNVNISSIKRALVRARPVLLN